MHYHPPIAITLVLFAMEALAAERQPVEFHVEQPTAAGQSVYVLGDIPELGANSAPAAVKLEPTKHPLWSATIAVPRGTTFTYRYILRDDAVPEWSDPNNFVYIPDPNDPNAGVYSGSTEPGAVYPPHKTIFLHSTWAQPLLYWRMNPADDFAVAAMTDNGPGREPGERRWCAEQLGVGDRRIEFYFEEQGGVGRDPSFGQYSTLLDVLFVQDANVLDYWPPPTLSNPAQTNFGTFWSDALQQNRPYRVLLPRGYQENTTSRYPVLYMHDGQNVFDQGPFGTWNADSTANAWIKRGWMQEVIIVAVDNRETRIIDYLPPDDSFSGQQGRANLYGQFLVNELKPHVDATYRTMTGRDATATIGSSMGGLVSLFLGWDFGAAFGRVGPMSGSWQFENFVNRVKSGVKRDLQIYIDSGDSGASFDNAARTMSLRDHFVSAGWALEGDLRHVVGYGQSHNEAAWANRLPKALEFMFPVDEGQLPLETWLYRGDCNCDALVNFGDIDYFVAAMTGEAAWKALYAGQHAGQHAGAAPPCRFANADADGSGAVDFSDIDPFVARLSGR